MSKEITLNHITKIEGHASLNLGIEKGTITKCELQSTEGARYFEGILRGRKYFEANEITSRICGICSCAHVICSITAIEDAIGFKNKELGVSGKLYNSNLVMYDRASDSDIPQILQTAVNGPTMGEELTNVHVYVTSWKQWKEKYPDTLVLSRNTGAARDYDRSPYPGYEDILRVWFPVAAESDAFSTKEVVTGVSLNNKYLAIHKEFLKKKGEVTQEFAGEEVLIQYDKKLDVIQVFIGEKQLPSFDVYWFAWYAYHPDTEIIR